MAATSPQALFGDSATDEASMKLVIEHEPYRALMLDGHSLEYAVYLDGTGNYQDQIHPVARFSTEENARRYCELRQQCKKVAEYDL